MVPPKPKQTGKKDATCVRLAKQNVKTLLDVLGQKRVLDDLASVVAGIFKGDPPAGSAGVTFGSGSTITVTVGVEPNQPNRTTYTVSVEQPSSSETTIASSTSQPSGNSLGSDYTTYNSSKTLKVKLTYREGGVLYKFAVTFPANQPAGSTMILALNAI